MVNKKKIAVIGLKGLPAFGGAASVGENIIGQLKGQYEFVVYAISSHTHLTSGNYGGIKQIVLRAISLKKFNSILYYIRAALHCLLFANYDLVQLHHRDAAFVALLLKIRYPIILTTHGIELTEKWKRFQVLFSMQDRLLLNLPDVVTCVSKKDLRLVAKIRKKTIKYIPNGAKIPLIEKKNYNVNNSICFAAGRLVPSKGCHFFLEALTKLNYDGKVLIAGDYTQMNDYRKQLIDLAKPLNVEWLGLIKDKKALFEQIISSDLFIFPSAIESMSMMLLEVASLGVPVIASDIPENQDVFGESEVLYFKTNDVQDLSHKIEWALQNYDIMIEKALNSKKKLVERYNWASISQEYKLIFDYLLAK